MKLPTSWLALALVIGLGGGAGCSSDDPAQIETVQVMANALRARNQEAACSLNVDALRSRVTCEGLIAQVLHYSPGLSGARIERRGPSSGWGWRHSKVVRVPMHFSGPDGKGDIDVTLHRTQAGWRIAAIFPKL